MAAVDIRRVGADFARWPAALALVRAAFADMDGRIAPPSSVHRLTAAQMAAEARAGAAFVAEIEGVLVGCLLCRPLADALYLGKLAVAAQRRGRGIARALVEAAAEEARARGLPALELQTRIELVENHAVFERLGFVRVGETSHAGFDRPTSITMRRRLTAS